ncbi:MAG TPA: alkane 1-monooxygenase [Arenimonas sp.]|nr:alkane 1-monooxygenase [Arenimonas sp.]
MNKLKALGFLFVFFVPLTLPTAAWLSVKSGMLNLMAWYPLFFLFVLIPALDYLLGHDPVNIEKSEESTVSQFVWFKALTLLVLPVQLATLIWSAQWFTNQDLSLVGTIGWLFSQGIVSSILAINVAHELIHKDAKLEKGIGGILLTSVGYYGFKIEHLRGHHVHVSTPEDASSARFGQNLWTFMPEALVRNTNNAWKLEYQRLRNLGLGFFNWRNEMLGWSLLWILFCSGFYFSLGWKGLLFFVLQGFFAACSLEVINYIEHYGLERKKTDDGRYERTTHMHSWNSDYALSNLMLFQLQRHSDHHAFPKRRYAILRHHEDSPQLPGGYSAMFVLALFPPLWHRVIDPRVLAHKATLS